MAKARSDEVPPGQSALTKQQFCKKYGYKPRMWWPMKKRGWGPPTIGEGMNERVTEEGEKQWLTMMAERKASKEAQLEAERRSKQASERATIGLNSPNHPVHKQRARRKAREEGRR
jgi:hypothetical protein